MICSTCKSGLHPQSSIMGLAEQRTRRAGTNVTVLAKMELVYRTYPVIRQHRTILKMIFSFKQSYSRAILTIS